MCKHVGQSNHLTDSLHSDFCNRPINETSTHAEILRIYQRASSSTRAVYDRGRDTDGVAEENWIIRWCLWHAFRYRDQRNNRSRPVPTAGHEGDHWGDEDDSSSGDLDRRTACNHGMSRSACGPNSHTKSPCYSFTIVQSKTRILGSCPQHVGTVAITTISSGGLAQTFIHEGGDHSTAELFSHQSIFGLFQESDLRGASTVLSSCTPGWLDSCSSALVACLVLLQEYPNTVGHDHEHIY